MEDLLSLDRLLAVWNAVYGWLRANVFVLDTAIQLGLVALTLLLAVLLAKRLRVAEMAVVTWAYEETARRKSYQLLAQAAGLVPAGTP